MQFKILTDASSTPISLADAKAHLFIYDTSEDTYIQSILLVAQQMVAQYLGEFITSTEVRVDVGGFGNIGLPHRFVESITKVEYYNTSDTATTIAASNYVLDDSANGSFIRFKSSFQSPELSQNYMYPIRITYNAGMTVVPETILQAMKITLGELYQSRSLSTSSNVQRLPLTAERLIQALRRF